MKALVLEDVGRLIYKEVPMPRPKAGEALIKVKACGICSSDFDRCFKTGTYHFPTIPGHEFAGQIVEVGLGVDAKWVGKRVAVFPLLPCGTCDQCRQEEYARCRNYNYFGSRCDGAFAEYIAAPMWNLQSFNDSLDYRVAALCEPAAVAFHAVSTANIKQGEAVCIVGTGTIGILCGLLARELGGVVSFVSRNEQKGAFLRELGFDSFVSPNTSRDFGFKNVIECVGSDESLNSAVDLAAAAGTVVIVGNPDGDKTMRRKTYWKILRSELTIQGVWNSRYKETDNDWRKVLDLLISRQKVFRRLITSEFPLSTGATAFASLRAASKIEIKGMFANE